MDFSELTGVSLGYALLLVALFTTVIVGSLHIARDALLSDYPPAIQERYGEQSERGRRTAAAAGLPRPAALHGAARYGGHARVP
ncbi:hypothetical protein [Streptomyces milbemycinicus]|uniref:Uncharacterized protein n=1 Tax=Streptomyces milbemycinicus TaxID=476552 RepID=A0ABW8LMP8_9ACTN